ncbi:MAG TPA: hypothetical protein VFS43_44450 [Polyangiaceae bacterium]|nr:hypothetical protein [Polyangiaceae bacterium]
MADDALDLTSEVDELEAPSSGCFTLLPPALPRDELDLIGPDSDVLSLAALEAAFDSLPFGEDDPCDVMIFFESDAPDAPENDGVPESKRPTRPYSIAGVPPCMRSTSRPAAQAQA